MKSWTLFVVIFAMVSSANARIPFMTKRLQDPAVAFQYVGKSDSRLGLLYADAYADSWAQENDGASIAIRNPYLLTTDSVWKYGEYLRFEKGSDLALCQYLGYPRMDDSGDSEIDANSPVAAVVGQKIVVGTPAQLAKEIGRAHV